MSINFYVRFEPNFKGELKLKKYYELELSRPSSVSARHEDVKYTLEGLLDDDVRKQYPKESAGFEDACKGQEERLLALAGSNVDKKLRVKFIPKEAKNSQSNESVEITVDLNLPPVEEKKVEEVKKPIVKKSLKE
jgi:hypothetical protein